MINISEEDKKFILSNVEDAENILRSGEVNDILDALSYVINRKGFDDYDYNDFGREAQKVYDRIYYYG